ncbi:MAG: prepilin peptidase [Phycisphaerales bacterium]
MSDGAFLISQITGRKLPAVDTSGLMLIQWIGALVGLAFVFAFGAIVGSFLNVVVYRLPRGLNLIRPASACPTCSTTLTWNENIPILGWVMLRGRCRFCRAPISSEYPIVELLTAVLFALVFAAWFMHPHLPGLDPRWWAPEWAMDGLPRMWPMALLVCFLLASLVAITLIDARTFTIPLSIPWLLGATALVVHPLHAAVIAWGRSTAAGGASGGSVLRSGEHLWCIPVAEGPWLAASFAAAVGLVISNGLLSLGWLKRSFADYDEWEKSHQARVASAGESSPSESAATPAAPAGPSIRVALLRTLFLTGPAVAGMFAGFSLGLRWDRPLQGMGFGMLAGLLVGLVLRRIVKDPQDDAGGGGAGGEGANGGSADPVWVQYPHARREMIRELAFLAPPALLAWAAFSLVPGTAFGAWLEHPPLWLGALGGSILGILIGGGIVWAIRIFGSLAFGKEAMGLGDVHLMAAVGAVLGWIDPLIAFFVAPFFGLGWAILGSVGGRLFPKLGGRLGSALPYGPHLAAATVVVIFLKPVLELGLGALMGRPVDLP